jgi:hypothetical protein
MILRRAGNAVRRALLRWQLIAVPVLPLWLIVGFGVFGAGPGALFVLMIGSMALFVFLAVLAGLTRLRPGVRERRRLGVADAWLTVGFHLAIVGLGVFGPTGVAFALAGILLGLGTFWLTLAELTREWRDRVRGVARQAPVGDPAPPRVRPSRRGPEDGDVIVVHETGR